MRNFRTFFSFLLVSFAFVQATAQADPQYTFHFPSFAACEQALGKRPAFAPADIDSLFRSFRFIEIPSQRGFVFSPKDGTTTERVIEWNGVSGFEKILSPEIWKLGEQRFQFADVGFKNLEADSQAFNRALVEHLYHYPNSALIIRYSAHRQLVESLLERYRWALHEKVVDTYRRMKPYLTDFDFQILTYLNHVSDNSDVFGILQHDPKNPRLADLDWETIKERLMLTIQVTYFGDRKFMRPSPDGIQLAAGNKLNDRLDKLPFEYRLHGNNADRFIKKLYKRFNPLTSCEITRYVKFDKSLPPEIREAVILKVFKTIQARKMKTIFASVDSMTERVFRKYGFQVYAPLPTTQVDVHEYLIYLKVDSARFKKVMKQLASVGRKVKVVPKGSY